MILLNKYVTLFTIYSSNFYNNPYLIKVLYLFSKHCDSDISLQFTDKSICCMQLTFRYEIYIQRDSFHRFYFFNLKKLHEGST